MNGISFILIVFIDDGLESNLALTRREEDEEKPYIAQWGIKYID